MLFSDSSNTQTEESPSNEGESSDLYLTCQFLSEPELKSATEQFFSVSQPFQIIYSIFLQQDILYSRESKQFVQRQSKKKAQKGKLNNKFKKMCKTIYFRLCRLK